jgi:AmmeMemoRadiSam system protein A
MLLSIARDVVEAAARREPSPAPPPELPDELQARCGAFVTLHCDGRLRGCIGLITSDQPLAATVTEMAEAAATRDPRFSVVTPEEAARCDIEISVMTPLRIVGSPDEVEVGRHGLVVSRGYYRGLLLPQVATEQHWDRKTFLDHTCIKAGLPPNAWKDPHTTIEVFEAEVFGEDVSA